MPGSFTPLRVTLRAWDAQGRFGSAAGAAFVALSVTQFHLPFYWSRSLPNTYALVMTCCSWTLQMACRFAGSG